MTGILHIIFIIPFLLILSRADNDHNCSPNQVYDHNTHTCIIICKPKCSNCYDQYTCLSCEDGFYFDENQSCVPCKIDSCKTCNSNFCEDCIDGYTLNDKQCIKIDGYKILTYAIGGVCVFLLLVFSGICYCVGKCQRRRTIINSISYNSSNQRIHEQPASMVQIKIDDLWAHNDEQPDLIKNQICSFCLENQVNTRLSCTHLYHVQCIMKWVKLHHECPLCKKIVLGNIKIYCSKCFQSSFEISSSFLVVQNLPKSSICQKCEASKKQIET